MKQCYNALLQMEALLIISFVMFNQIESNQKDNFKIYSFKKANEDSIKFIQSYVISFAEDISKMSNLKLKRKISGDLPDSYPKRMKIRARKLRENKDNFKYLMDIPIEPWRFCIYPQTYFKLNINTYCDQKFSKSNLKKFGCKNSYCNFCCDNSKMIIENQSKKIRKLSKSMSLPKTLMNQVITDFDISRCKKKCNSIHKVNYPLDLPSPPRDKKLGTLPQFAAKSCSDIKKWGKLNNKSGEYWIEYGNKNIKVKVFCDMETDKGGWTLFFNYVHFPGQEVKIDSSKIPNNLKMNNHINLKDIDLTDSDVSELRFFCTERLKTKKFIHFKISNLEIINLALTGNQKSVRKSNYYINNSLRDLKFPYFKKDSKKWQRTMGAKNIGQVDTINESSNGGFWDTPFGSQKLKKFWTIKGNLNEKGRFECGSYHDGGNSIEDNLVQTHHSVWFRGPALSVEESRNRFTLRNKK